MFLITGAAGFIGSTLANYYSKENKVVIIDNLSMGEESNINFNENVTFIKGDVCDNELMERVLSEYQFEYIFHLAAIASVADSVERPVETHMVNFQSVFNLLELTRKYQKIIKRFIFSSSAAVYGDELTLPKKEESVIRPLTPYAIDKFAAEKYVLSYNDLYGIPTSAVRFFNVFGCNQNSKSPYSGVISILIDCYKKLLNGEEVIFSLFGDGNQSRDFIYIEDVIKALDLVSKNQNSLGEVYNIGTGKATSLNKLIEIINTSLNVNLQIIYKESRLGDIQDSLADITKIKNIGFIPNYSIEEGLKNYLEYEFFKSKN